MKHLNCSEIQLLEFETSQNQPNFMDFAGFPPYIRGREVLPFFPKIVENDFSDDSFHIVEINFQDNWAEKLMKGYSISQKNQKKTAVIVSFSTENTTDFIAFVRALRGIFYLLTKEKLFVFLKIFERDLSLLPMIFSCEIDVVFCDEFLKKKILKLKRNIFSRTIDPFGGDLFIEQKTKEFIKKYI